MPQLCAFIVCEKIIIDDSGVASLISLFTAINVIKQRAEGIPPTAVVAKEWAVFTAWDPEPDDDEKEFSQFIQVFLPDGTPFGERSEIRFHADSGKRQQNKMPLVGFPIGQEGSCTIRMWLEHQGTVVLEPRPVRIQVKHTQ